MKTIGYWILISILLLLEATAVYLFISRGEDGYELALVVHLVVAFAFGIMTGMHRKSVSIALLSILVIGTNPIAGILTMILIDEKFNRERRQLYFESAGGFEIGNPFNSREGIVELASNDDLIQKKSNSVIKRVMHGESEVSEREVEVLTSIRSLSILPLLEKISSTSTGESRVLAQAAISEMSERAAIWSANLHRLEISDKAIPESIEQLAVTAFLEIRKQGRAPQAFGLPDSNTLKDLLRERLKTKPNSESTVLLTELLIQDEEFDEALKLIHDHRKLPGFDFEVQLVKILSARGDWVGLLKQMPTIKRHHWDSMPEEVRRFWGVN